MSDIMEGCESINIKNLSEDEQVYIGEILRAFMDNRAILSEIILSFSMDNKQHVTTILGEYMKGNTEILILNKMQFIQQHYELQIAKVKTFDNFYILFQDLSGLVGEEELECVINLSSSLKDNPVKEFVNPIFYGGKANNIHCKKDDINFQIDSPTATDKISEIRDYKLFQIYIKSKIKNDFLVQILSTFIHKFDELMIVKESEIRSNINALTLLRNKPALNIILESEFNIDQNLSYCFIDLNNFKAINDNYGHENGDEVLRQVAKVLYKISAQYKGYAFNTGGDEFALILPDCNYELSIQIGNQIVKEISILGFIYADNSDNKYFNVTPSLSMVTRYRGGTQGLGKSYDLPKVADRYLELAKEKSTEGGRQTIENQRSLEKFNGIMVHANNTEIKKSYNLVTHSPITRYMKEDQVRKKQLTQILGVNGFVFHLGNRHPKELGINHSDIILLDDMKIDPNILKIIKEKCNFIS